MNDPVGTIYIDRIEYDKIRFVVLRGPIAYCAYLGIPLSHPIANLDYDDVPLSAHGGLTYSGEGVIGIDTFGLYWYGWDYGHAGDVTLNTNPFMLHLPDDREWTPDLIDKDSWCTIYDFKKLLDLIEKVTSQQLLNNPTFLSAEKN